MARNTRQRKQLEKKSVATAILAYITKNPGVHFKDLNRALNLAPGTLQYHLYKMEQVEDIRVLRKQYFTSYFPPSMKDPLDQKIMVLLRQNIPRNLIILLLEKSEKSGLELATSLKITKSTLSYYTKRLVELDILSIKVEGREKRYSVNNPERTTKLMKDYKESFGDKVVNRFIDLWVRI
jgi:predicted transcriptional regulator